MSPGEAANALARIAYLLRLQADQHRARAFSRAAVEVLARQPDLDTLRSKGRLESIEGVGAGIARTLAELIDTGESSYLNRLLAEERTSRPTGPESAPRPAPVGVPSMDGYRGDLHSHTDWSDGGATLREMALAARARGYEYLAVTDHSPRITVVHGLGPERLAEQRRAIDQVNAELDGLTLLQGCEVDVLEDGRLDLPDEALAALDLVIASPHVKLRMERAAMTERMLRAVCHPEVDMVGHPTGRRPGARPGAEYDSEAVFAAAAARGVIMEIDCDPARMDLSPEMAGLAAALGCRLALDSDAHAPDQFGYVDLALWCVGAAGIDVDRVVNWMPLDRLRIEVLA